MHALIMKPHAGMMVDHKNGDGLDNQKSNLRICTNQQNLRNRGKTRVNTSGYKGVYREKRSRPRPWVAEIRLNGKSKRLGRYADKKDAAKAFDVAAIFYHGDFAHVNFPELMETYRTQIKYGQLDAEGASK